MTDSPYVSVVVLSYRNRDTIVDAVSSIVDQECAESFEVVVAASGDDGSAELVRDRFPDVTVVHSRDRLFAGGARNLGTAASTGEIVAFLCGDCIAMPGWLQARVRAHRTGSAAVACTMTTAPPQRPAAWALHFDMYCQRLTGRAAGPIAASDAAAYGLSLERTLLERIGQFDDTVERDEDTMAAARVGELGMTVWLEPTAVTAHCGPTRTLEMLRDARRRSEHSARVKAGIGRGRVSRRTVLRDFVPMWWQGVRRRAALSWRYGNRTERTRLVASFPWLLAARAAAPAGWYSGRRNAPK